MKFHGTKEDLESILSPVGYTGPSQKIEHGHRFEEVKTRDGVAIVNWYDSSGSVVCQGPKSAKERMEEHLGAHVDAGGRAAAASSEPEAREARAELNPRLSWCMGTTQQHANNWRTLVLHKLGLMPTCASRTLAAAG